MSTPELYGTDHGTGRTRGRVSAVLYYLNRWGKRSAVVEYSGQPHTWLMPLDELTVRPGGTT